MKLVQYYIDDYYMPLKSLMNDTYAKDISKKTKSAFAVKRKNGEFIGAVAPYGYLKCGECGSKFTKAGKYYYCNNYARTGSCTKHSTNRENLINYIEREMKAKHIKYDERNRQVLFEFVKDIVISENGLVKINYKSRK